MDFKSLKPYVRQAMEKKVKASAELPIRYLVAYEIAIITEGEALMIMNDVPYTLSKGDVFLYRPTRHIDIA